MTDTSSPPGTDGQRIALNTVHMSAERDQIGSVSLAIGQLDNSLDRFGCCGPLVPLAPEILNDLLVRH